MFECRFVVLVVDHGAQRAVGLLFECRVEGQGPRFGRFERRPVVGEQDVGRVAGQPAARGVLMVQREERMPGVGQRFEKCVAEERLVERQLVEHLPQALPVAVYVAQEGREPGLLHLVAREALARNVVGLVVDDAAVGH